MLCRTQGHVCIIYLFIVGRDSSVGIATRYGLEGPGIESRRERDFLNSARLGLGPAEPSAQWAPGLFPGGKVTGALR